MRSRSWVTYLRFVIGKIQTVRLWLISQETPIHCHTVPPVFDCVAFRPDLDTLVLRATLVFARHTQFVSLQFPHRRDRVAELDRGHCPVGTEAVGPMKVVGDAVADDARADFSGREALEGVLRIRRAGKCQKAQGSCAHDRLTSTTSPMDI